MYKVYAAYGTDQLVFAGRTNDLECGQLANLSKSPLSPPYGT
jgi:hypothetical protein